MKRFIYNIIPFILALCLLQACKKETTEGYTHVTTFPLLSIEGSSRVTLPLGGTFSEPGYIATIDGNDVSEKVAIKSTINANKIGAYNVTYSIANEEGYKAEVTRDVYVYDPTPSIMPSKAYQVQSGSNRNGTVSFNGYTIAVYQTSPGIFTITDFLGGYYDKRAGYGIKYAALGKFKLNGDNTLSLIESFVAGWGDSLSALENGKFDPATKTISFTAVYAGFNFNIILK
ncbi:BT_2262 family domain-containing protein [Sphingobacterium thalpophilum]|uniref:BT_2262 family domain-containing protein n=1 Tax=Sphingobacterium thalpophilum TaxID=259 RepID=UPI0024A645C0|nr:BT_2262 family domain-containing protein [Sphingobacterium thalpophilum]